MTKRQRIEDLGKLAIMLRVLFEDELFSLASPGRKKDYPDLFLTLSKDEKHDIITKVVYGLENIHFLLADCLSIADGDDTDISE